MLLAICIKVYDDLNDMNILKSDIINEIIKALSSIFLTLVSINDFNFSVFFYLLNLGNSIANLNEWSSPYESSLLYLYPIFFILSFHTREYLTFFDIIICVSGIGFGYIEPLLVTEEISYKKIIGRVFVILNSSILFYFSSYFNISPFLIKAFYFFMAYNIVSIYFQLSQLVQAAESKTLEGTPPSLWLRGVLTLALGATEKLDQTNTTLL